MNGAAGAVAGELGQVEQLRHGALPGKGGVAVKQQRQHAFAVGAAAIVAENPLAGAGFALDDGVDGFEVARVGGEAYADLAIGEFAVVFVAEVVFHIAVAGDRVRDVVGGEFVENGGDRLADEIGQHIEPAAVRHAHLDLRDAQRRAVFQNGVEGDQRAFAAFQRKPLFPEEFLPEKLLEGLGFQQPPQRIGQPLGRVGGRGHAGFDARARPVADGGVVEVHELKPDRSGVGGFQRGDQIAQFQAAAVLERRLGHGAVQFLGAEARHIGHELRVAGGRASQRIDVGLSVTERAEIEQQADQFAGNSQLRPAGGIGVHHGGSLLGLGVAKFETLEKCRPRGLDQTRIFPPLGVFLFEQIRVGAGCDGGVHGWKIGKIRRLCEFPLGRPRKPLI